MGYEPFSPSVDEVNYFLVAFLVVAAAFIAYRGEWGLNTVIFYLFASTLVIIARELGQRIIAHWMEAEVTMNLSVEGSSITVIGAIFAVLTDIPIILLFPLSNSFSLNSYEHWGKSIDAMWMKREYWLVSGGFVALLIGWVISVSAGLPELAKVFSIFTLFQLLPIDYKSAPTGALDGAYILRQSGFIWLLMFGLTLLSLVPV